ncbi:hypothetical protein HGM15179_022158 [Zosterops borbonicus]|uniref:Uncharacterized protein n=1 Tax=Zosterops borbonicus TaxID=364589 RepID=A0A8K1D344_9PASS|nr:hypothetical protein HGM15179_022158 [Zosterops borbonicus]
MKAYVQRCFTACESEEDKDRTEKLLKELLQARLQDGSAFTIDWSREPLPGPEPCPPRRARRRPPCEPEDPERELRRQRRAQRFQGGAGTGGHPKKARPNPPPAPGSPPGHGPAPGHAPGHAQAEGLDWEQVKILGTCQEVTKKYLRLTCAPDPATVRPVPVSDPKIS